MSKLLHTVIAVVYTAILALSLTSCDSNSESSIPNVSFRLSYNTLQNPIITNPGQFVKITKNVNGLSVGYGGILLGKSIFAAFGDDQYVAFDAACPVEASASVSVTLLEDGLGTAVCPKCKTKYNLSNHAFPEGVGTEYLKSYKVVVNGNTLLINN